MYVIQSRYFSKNVLIPRSVQKLVRIFFLSYVCDFTFFRYAQRPPTDSPPSIPSPQSGIQTSIFPRLMPPNLFRSPCPLFTSLLPSALFSLALYFLLPTLYLLPPTVTCSAPSYVLPTLKAPYSIYSDAMRPSLPCSTTDRNVTRQCKIVLGFGLRVQPSGVVHGPAATLSLSK